MQLITLSGGSAHVDVDWLVRERTDEEMVLEFGATEVGSEDWGEKLQQLRRREVQLVNE